MSNDHRIAVVGYSCILPSGENVQESWESLRAGLDCIKELPSDRLDVTAYYNPDQTVPDKIYCTRGGFIPDFEFEPSEFNFNMLQMEDTDANQTLSLLKVKEALEDASIDPSAKVKKNIGCVLGIGGGQKASNEFYSRLSYTVVEKVLQKMGLPEEDVDAAVKKFKAHYPEWRLDSFPGFLGNVTAGRVTNVFNLDGMNCVVDAACASSLVAVKVAIEELLFGDCETMIAGATCTDCGKGMFMAFSKTPVFSRQQSLTAYDKDTEGMLIGEGSVMLVLKKLSTAIRDGDTVHAVIRGVASSSDGKAPGIYAPTIEGQEACITRALRNAGVDPSEISLIEGHGTGTRVGDAIELTALKNVLGQDGRKQNVAVGSVKSNIGHLKAAAGMAGLLKTILALKHKTIPKSINVKEPPTLRDGTKIQDTCLFINTRMRPWFTEPGKKRIAGVSSFGFGGSNYHCIVEEFEAEHEKPYRVHAMPSTVLFAGANAGALADSCDAALHKLKTSLLPVESGRGTTKTVAVDVKAAAAAFMAVAKENALRPVPMSHARVGFVTTDCENCVAVLEAVVTRLRTKDDAKWTLPKHGAHYRAKGHSANGKVCTLFSGQGSQYSYMFDDVAMNWPEFRKAVSSMDAKSEVARPASTPLVSEVLYPRGAYACEEDPQHDRVLADTLHSQPTTVAVAVGAYEILAGAGLKADFAAGHSLGELPALYAAGKLGREEVFELVCHRATAMAASSQSGESSTQAMAAVIGDGAPDVKISPEHKSVWIANYNSPQQIVISGEAGEVAAESAKMEARGFRVVPLKVSGAFHTPLMQAPASVFAERLRSVVTPQTFKKGSAVVYSNVTGESGYNTAHDAVTLLSKHMTNSVHWVQQVKNMHRDGARVFVEFGPQSTLTKLVDRILPAAEDLLVVAVNPTKQKSADLQLREAAVQLSVYGVELNGFDPWSVPNPHVIKAAESVGKRKRMALKLSAATFVSPGTIKKRDAIMNDGYTISGKPSAELAELQKQVQQARVEAAEAKRNEAALKQKLAELERKAAAAPAAVPKTAEEPVANDPADQAAKDAEAAAREVTLSYAATQPISLPAKCTMQFGRRPVLVVDDGTAFTDELCKSFAASGIQSVVVCFASAWQRCERTLPAPSIVLADRSEAALQAMISEITAKHGDPCGLVYQHCDLDTSDDHEQLRWSILAAKHLSPALHKPIDGARCFFVVVAHLGNSGCLGVQNEVAGTGDVEDGDNSLTSVLRAQRGAAFGLCKALDLEWGHIFCRGIDVSNSLAAPRAAELVCNEVFCPDVSIREVGYDRTEQRYTTVAKPLKEGSGGATRAAFTSSDVLMVTGGGRGITPVCLSALAARVQGGTYFLLGRSKLTDDPAWSAGIPSEGKALEAAAMAHLKAEFAAGRGAKPTPKAHQNLCRSVRDAREVRESLEMIQKRGGKAVYMSCDANDVGQVRKALAKIKSEYNLAVTGIVHAAGVLRDKKVENKASEDFDMVYGVKVTGLANLLTALSSAERHQIKHLVVFSSLAGFHGNAAQTDYAMANDALSKMAHRFGATHSNCSVRALCFGPWDGGMVTPALKAMFTSQGVQIIPRKQGAEQVAALLTMSGKDRSQVLVGNWGLPPVAPLSERLSIVWPMPRSGQVDQAAVQKAIDAAVLRTHPGWYVQSSSGASALQVASGQAEMTISRPAGAATTGTNLTVTCVVRAGSSSTSAQVILTTDRTGSQAAAAERVTDGWIALCPAGSSQAASPPPAQDSAFWTKGSKLEAEIAYQRAQDKKYAATGKPLLWDFDDLLQYAEGDIAPVFNKHKSGVHEPWELVDTYSRRVRLPQREYLLCSRVTKMNATTNVFAPCTMTTEYDLPINGELSEGGDVPWAVLVESGQCDLMLISYLGIDFQCKGERVYRLLDTTLTFYGVAKEGQTLSYDISINSFAQKQGQVSMFFFSYNCYVDGKLLIEMRNGVAGFFSEEELAAGKGVVWTEGERKMRNKQLANLKDVKPFMLAPATQKTSFSEADMQKLSVAGQNPGTWGSVLGATAAEVRHKLCARKMLMIDRMTHVIPTGGKCGLGLIIGEKITERDHWYFPCHFKNDEVMAGSLVSDGCSQMLKVYMLWLGMHKAVDSVTFRPVYGVPNKVRCRGQISPHRGKLVYWMEITELGFDPKTGFPYAKADVNIIDVNFELGQSFDYSDEASLLAALDTYCKGDLARRVVVDFRGVALQIEGQVVASGQKPAQVSPYASGGLHLAGGFRSSLPPSKFMKWGAVVVDFRGVALQIEGGAAQSLPKPLQVSSYEDGGLHLAGGFRSPLPPSKFMKWGATKAEGAYQPSVEGLCWHPLAGVNGNPIPGFTPTAYPPRPICFLPFPNNPNDNNHVPGELPLSWVNLCELSCNKVSRCLGDEFAKFDDSTTSRFPAFDLCQRKSDSRIHPDRLPAATDLLPAIPKQPEDNNHVPGELPLSWVNLCEFMCNKVSRCLGDEFAKFDDSTTSRSPAFDLQMVTRVLSVTGLEQEKGSTKWYGVDTNPSKGTMVAQFDCPADAWFFKGASNDAMMPYSTLMEIGLQTSIILTSWLKAPLTMPGKNILFRNLDVTAKLLRHVDLAWPDDHQHVGVHRVFDARGHGILMEIGLQTSGILTSWVKAPLTMPGKNILFRNLDATAKLLRHVDLRGQTITNTSVCTGYSMLGDMGIHRFKCTLAVDGSPFYEVDTSFGWFVPEVFEKQVGLDGGKKCDVWHKKPENSAAVAAAPVVTFALPADGDTIYNAATTCGSLPAQHALRRRSRQVQFLDGVTFAVGGGMHGQGYAHGFKNVDKKDWFFSCHFWCDPVMPGSLGIEAMHESLELYCVHSGLTRGVTRPQFNHDLGACIILTSWLKAPLTMPGKNILFRNLDVTAKLLRHVDLRGQTITNTSVCTGYSMLGDMGVHRFKCTLAVDGSPFYEVDASYGWFVPEVFDKQAGLDGGKKRDVWHKQPENAAAAAATPFVTFALPGDENAIFDAATGSGSLSQQHAVRRRSPQVQFLDGVTLAVGGGMHGQGYAHGFKNVDKKDWFFSCHFWCDPVMPGSLGIEAMHESLELYCVHSGLTRGVTRPQFNHDLGAC
eukprot:CAMPEP_0204506614 /NCGR_PEP_ID=MMETSP0471-20130131/109330_1 /ASSEMBLY_ACC=CAM_ASM_000602 /TAXON_ID=2969 /ORGANISM="Oxyrrhis marina" /LENGTH=3079 /DNA_ID=CAMNT_0051511623 /DNA_START=34 /DNA_END=9271 /DNA_ORIENTATION=+